MGMLSGRGDDGIDTDNAAVATDGIDAAVDVVKGFSERVANLVKRDEPDRFLVSDPLQGHAGYVCT